MEEREKGHMREVIEKQVKLCFRGAIIKEDQTFWINYEPRWAIGTGITPSFEEIGEIHSCIKSLLLKYYGSKFSAKVPIIYGGSVQSKNVSFIYSQKCVDGVGFGKCSLDIKCFSDAILNALKARKSI